MRVGAATRRCRSGAVAGDDDFGGGDIEGQLLGLLRRSEVVEEKTWWCGGFSGSEMRWCEEFPACGDEGWMGKGTVREFNGGKERKKGEFDVVCWKEEKILGSLFFKTEDECFFFFLFTDERGREKREFRVAE